MKWNRLAGLLVYAALLASTAACAHQNGTTSRSDVRVTTDAQDVRGCEKLTQVRLSGTWTSGEGLQELESLVRSKGGNVLLLTGAGTPNSGVAYRCSGGTGAGSL